MKPTLFSLALVALAAPAALSCIGGNLESVHFNSDRPDFGTPPRRGLASLGEQDDRAMTTQDHWMGDYSTKAMEFPREDGTLAAKREELYEHLREAQTQARPLLERGAWKPLRDFWQTFQRTHDPLGEVQDRLEVLGHPNLSGVSVQAYLQALDTMSGPNANWNAAIAAFHTLAQDNTLPRWLREHAAYQEASGMAQWLNYRQALLLWQAQLRRFPEGEKREAALVMIARAALLHKALPDSVPTGRAALNQLLHAFPKTHFRVIARGLLARADLDDGNFEKAAQTYCALSDGDSILRVRWRVNDTTLNQRLVTLQLIAYLRALNNATNFYAYRFSIKGVSGSLAALKPEAGRRFLAYLNQDASVSAPYFYYRLYHCDNDADDLRRLAVLANQIAKRHILPAVVRVRLAEIYYQNRAYTKAVRWASSATEDLDQKVRARALYVRAGCRYRHCQFEPARADLERLLAECTRSGLRHGAHELLALCAERLDDFPQALDNYFAIDYREDYAYLVDARMPLTTLENYWHTRTHHRDLLAYSIALRHLRLEHWDEARRWLDRVPGKVYRDFVGPLAGREEWDETFAQQGANPKKVLANLSGLWRTAETARGSEAKAAARYAYARAYYTQGLLQLYNAPLWQGERMMAFGWYWNSAIATSVDDKAVQRYMYQHEVYAHTRRICLDIVREYPNTKTAPYALYRAACAADRIRINGWWDEEGHPVCDHQKESSKLMALLVKRYPHHPLAPAARKYSQVFEGKGDPAE